MRGSARLVAKLAAHEGNVGGQPDCMPNTMKLQILVKEKERARKRNSLVITGRN